MTKQHYQPFPTQTPPELKGAPARVYPVAIIGGGPIGLAAAVDLAQHGVEVIVLDQNNTVSVGSRAICWAKRTLDIFDRLGVGERMVRKGVTWQTGRLFHAQQEVFNFDLLPDTDYKMPAFVNLQQYHVEQYLVDRAGDFPDLIDLRFNNTVTDHVTSDTGVSLQISTPEGDYSLQAEYVIACDGANSPTRKRMGLSFEGESFEERFLIADIEMEDDPFANADNAERWFWFKPPFHEGQSALLHKQPDNIYRIDLQLGADTNPEEESRHENVTPRIQQIMGDKSFQLDWVSVYRFRCARLAQFVHGRLLFAGDSAHVVSPFGARGGNGGTHDVDNLCWKLAAVIQGRAPASLLDSYEQERGHGADENIRHSARATRFMSPANDMERLFRDEILSLAADLPFARAWINSGRLSTPCSLIDMPLQTSDTSDTLADDSRCGLVAPDLPLDNGDWLLASLSRNSFTLLLVGVNQTSIIDSSNLLDALPVVTISLTEHAQRRYGRGAFLIRPDQHIAARWEGTDLNASLVRLAWDRALGLADKAHAA